MMMGDGDRRDHAREIDGNERIVVVLDWSKGK